MPMSQQDFIQFSALQAAEAYIVSHSDVQKIAEQTDKSLKARKQAIQRLWLEGDDPSVNEAIVRQLRDNIEGKSDKSLEERTILTGLSIIEALIKEIEKIKVKNSEKKESEKLYEGVTEKGREQLQAKLDAEKVAKQNERRPTLNKVKSRKKVGNTDWIGKGTSALASSSVGAQEETEIEDERLPKEALATSNKPILPTESNAVLEFRQYCADNVGALKESNVSVVLGAAQLLLRVEGEGSIDRVAPSELVKQVKENVLKSQLVDALSTNVEAQNMNEEQFTHPDLYSGIGVQMELGQDERGNKVLKVGKPSGQFTEGDVITNISLTPEMAANYKVAGLPVEGNKFQLNALLKTVTDQDLAKILAQTVRGIPESQVTLGIKDKKPVTCVRRTYQSDGKGAQSTELKPVDFKTLAPPTDRANTRWGKVYSNASSIISPEYNKSKEQNTVQL